MKTKQPTSEIQQKMAELKSIATWYENQNEPDLETGLQKLKIAAKLIADLKKEFVRIENEFEVIKKNLD